MVANRLRNLVSLTRGAVRDARQALDELINSLGPRPQPALVRVPVRNTRGPRFPVPNGRRGFSTSARALRSTTTTFGNNFIKTPRFTKPTSNIAGKLWPYSAFRRPAIGKGPFPSGLYRNFVNLNSRQFSTFGGNVSREAVQNLTTSLRCFLNNGGDLVLSSKMSKGGNPSSISYHGCASTNEAPQTFQMARTESTDIQTIGAFVEFTLPKLELSIPSMSFINSEILETIESDLETIKYEINEIQKQVQLISDTYGALPLERRKDAILIHFPNLDVEEVEKLLIELGIDKGIVYSNDINANEVEPELTRSSSSTSYTSLSDDELSSLSDMVENAIPDLISTGSEESSIESREFFPILSSSESNREHSEMGESYYFADNADSPITFAHSSHTFSEIAV
ncbi:Stationary phase protein 5 [Wickerhamomyces ciferrii]|uniref:Stationary phase protein 5 n=1 Tax=Wickerhamomyces ciferrii (strain ATCC 14091 / BCRC 22168 / CBS 111 / JCM 3599 / NBRC 0793 / NRRL Y-1031 F-60-10) TaxID=1206466 RepID=K0KI38_WICCF|nr:Stationary phase protein 5 [Wickerhamomyces ciferrii]CCH44875.1 Stationary phase protein 5 [Wickerhamomyces ciferrii]